MKISTSRFWIITILIILIPIYGNWKLLLNGKKADGVVVTIEKESIGQLFSYYSIIQFKAGQETINLRGPENVEYAIGREFKVLYLPKDPNQAILMTIKGIYLNRYTAVSIVLLLLWMAFYLSFTPKSQKRKSEATRFSTNGKFKHKELH